MSIMKLTVVIVSYNVKYYLEQCLISLERALKGVEAEIVVVDNDSRDGTVDYLKSCSFDVRIIESNHNLGFARANNIAIEQTDSEYVLLLNPDTVVGESVIRDTLEFMNSHPDAGGLGVQMIKSDGNKALESRRGLPTPLTSFYKMTGLCSRYPRSRRFGRYYMGYLPWDVPSQIEVVSGAFFLLRREALYAVGLLDEDFFMYGEDIDLSYRLLKGGYANWYYPARILHYKGESTQKSSFRYVHVFYDAMLIFFRKHYGNASLCLTIPIKAAIYFKALLALVGMQIERAKKALGFWHVRNKPANYIFFVDKSNEADCYRLVRSKGLTAEIITSDKERFEEGHYSIGSMSNDRQTYVVYDSSKFDNETIMELFASRPSAKVKMGIYHPEKNMVITEQEVLK